MSLCLFYVLFMYDQYKKNNEYEFGEKSHVIIMVKDNQIIYGCVNFIK